MSMTRLSKGGSCLFINPVVVVEINPSLTIHGAMQVIIGVNEKNSKMDIEESILMDITKVEYLGFELTDMDKIKSFIDSHNSMGIDVWQRVESAANEVIETMSPSELVWSYSPFNLS